MSTIKKVTDFLYRGFTLSMVTLTVYGGVVLTSRWYNMIEERKVRQKDKLLAAGMEESKPATPTEAVNT